MTIADICPTDRFRLQSANVIKFETLLMEMINNALSKDRKLYRRQIHTFAGRVKTQFPDSAEVQALVFSDRWWRCFRDAHRLTYRRISGTKDAVITHDIEDRMNEIRAEVALYDKKNVLNLDESRFSQHYAGAMSWLTPKAIKNNTLSGAKSKKGVTVSAVISLSGQVEYIYFIHKCLEKSIRQKLPNNSTWKSDTGETQMRSYNKFDYFWNRSGWSRSDLFKKVLQKLDRRARQENEKKLLLLDGHASHKLNIELTNITISFLPPNCTHMFQPIDWYVKLIIYN